MSNLMKQNQNREIFYPQSSFLAEKKKVLVEFLAIPVNNPNIYQHIQNLFWRVSWMGTLMFPFLFVAAEVHFFAKKPVSVQNL